MRSSILAQYAFPGPSLLINIAHIGKVTESNRPLNLICRTAARGIFAGPKGRHELVGPEVDSFRDQVEPQYAASMKRPSRASMRKARLRKTAKFPNMLAAGPAKPRSTPGAKGPHVKTGEKLV
jgi:hypothetical protein